MLILKAAGKPVDRVSPQVVAATWHIHPLRQMLIVTAGCGRVQLDGAPVLEIRPGDTVWIAPDERHWHGAAPGTAMTHIAIQEMLDGSSVTWSDHVTDEEYGVTACG